VEVPLDKPIAAREVRGLLHNRPAGLSTGQPAAFATEASVKQGLGSLSQLYTTLLEVSDAIASHRDLGALMHDLTPRLRGLVEFDGLALILHGEAPKTMSLYLLEGLGLAHAEKEHIVRAIRESRGVIGGLLGAAALLGMKRTTLQARMRKLGISRVGPFDGEGATP